jgi:glycosyltransferase involved in cell wall biosynthesis
MKILQICNKVPYPAKDGGAIAVLNLSEVFALNGHQVTILAMNTGKHHSEVKSIPGYYTEKIHFVYVPVNSEIKPFKLIFNYFFSSLPYNAVRFMDKKFEEELKKLLIDNTFDIIQLEGLYLLPYVDVIRQSSKAKIVYRAHNIEHEIWTRLVTETVNPLKKIYLASLARRIKKFETDCLNSYDLLVPITERDHLRLNSMGNMKPAHVSPTGISIEKFKKNNNSYIPDSLFYIGALDWFPNQEGLSWFIDHVWPFLKEEKPEVSFHVAGRNSPKWLQKKCLQNRIEFHGEIENAQAFFDSYQIMVVPLFAGSGMRIKIVEAMARSKVIITTTIGAEGIAIENKVHAVISDTSQSFVKEISYLLENNDYFKKIEWNAYELAEHNYSNTGIGKDLINFYRQYSI